jgi:peptidyl-prolyl cis-trans isomerase SurA
MRKGLLLALFSCLLLVVHTGHAQTLFTYGPNKVSREEFLKAFRKNNAEGQTNEKAFRDYLDLYIRFKLKVQAARDLKMDTSQAQQQEIQVFRDQIADGFMTDEATLNRLIDEVLLRQEKDIHLGHIYLSVPPNPSAIELQRVWEKARGIHQRLEQGASFESQAREYSDDPAAATHQGDIGFITALVLPYALENAVYALTPGAFSAPVQEGNGIHIFKHLGERKALGTVKVAQVLISFPPDASTEQRTAASKLADSLYQLLKSGADFGKIALQYSADNLTYQTGGELQEFGVGEYEPAFEAAAFTLAEDGEISAPIPTSYGYHIIKRLGRNTIWAATNTDRREACKRAILENDRNALIRAALLARIKSETQFRPFSIDSAALDRIADSLLQGKPMPVLPGIKESTPVMAYDAQQVNLGVWTKQLSMMVELGTASSAKSGHLLFKDFIESNLIEYYRSHLERFNKNFAAQLQEFKDGNLLFEIMQRKIWDVAAADTAALEKYYEAHKSNYWWEPSADALVVTASDEAVANEAVTSLTKNVKNWRTLIAQSNSALQGDSGRFELSQMPLPEGTQVQEGMVTPSMKNEADNIILFCYILKVYPQKEPRSFPDAKGFVINDYQNELENRWVTTLRSKYPVKVNEAVFKTLLQ